MSPNLCKRLNPSDASSAKGFETAPWPRLGVHVAMIGHVFFEIAAPTIHIVPRCSFWEPCSWAQEEAERLRQRMKLEVLHALPLQGPAQAGCISPLGGPSPCPPHTTHKLYAGQRIKRLQCRQADRPAQPAQMLFRLCSSKCLMMMARFG